MPDPARHEHKLAPMVDRIGDLVIEHGERDDLDPANPEACLCGEPNYLLCDGPGIESVTLRPALCMWEHPSGWFCTRPTDHQGDHE